MAVAQATAPRAARRGVSPTSLLVYLALIVGGFFMFMPFVYMLSTSLKPANQVFLYPPRWIPDPIVWNNYLVAAGRLGFGAFLNSLIFTVTIVLDRKSTRLNSSHANISYAV